MAMPLSFALALLSGATPLIIQIDDQRATIAMIEKLGGRVEYDVSGVPVAVRIWWRELKAEDLKVIGQLTTLQELDLYACEIEDCDTALKHLAPLKRLTHLIL